MCLAREEAGTGLAHWNGLIRSLPAASRRGSLQACHPVILTQASRR